MGQVATTPDLWEIASPKQDAETEERDRGQLMDHQYLFPSEIPTGLLLILFWCLQRHFYRLG